MLGHRCRRRLDVEGRSGLLSCLAGPAAVEAALAEGDHVDGRRRVLTGEANMRVVLALCLFSGEGYDSVLSRVVPLLGGAARRRHRTPKGQASRPGTAVAVLRR
jgi:hypothetical protein